MAAHFAAVRMTTIVVHQAVDMPWDEEDVVTELWPALTAEAPEADRAAAALRYVWSWACGHREGFFRQHQAGQAPASGWAGRWELEGVQGNQAEGYIGLLPHKLNEALQDGGFEPEPILRLWHERDWLKGTENRRQYKARVGAASPRLYAIKRAAIEEVDGPPDEEGDGDRQLHPFPRVGGPAAG